MAAPATAHSRIAILTACNSLYDMSFEENVVMLYKPRTIDPYASFEYKKVYIVISGKNKTTSLLIPEFFQKQEQIKDRKALQDYCLTLKDLRVEFNGYDRLSILFKSFQLGD